uniref:Uncharacterized protein n=1 Tax=Rhizophora mucronata TaxID=61149 RepID=A0A2P2PTR9_RHIMU
MAYFPFRCDLDLRIKWRTILGSLTRCSPGITI